VNTGKREKKIKKKMEIVITLQRCNQFSGFVYLVID